MNRFMAEAFVEKYSFLKELFNNRDAVDIDSVKIERIDEDLLSRVPSYSGATGSLVGIDDSEAVHFVLADGTVIKNAVKSAGSCIHNEAHSDDESWGGETILEAIEGRDMGDAVAYIVRECSGYVIRDHYSVGGYSIVIYKPSEGKSIADYLAEAQQRAKEDVATEV